jgi:hypothetical protein
MGGQLWGPTGVLPTGFGPATAFDPATAFGSLVFSNANLTVSHSGGNTSDGVWTLKGSVTSQKVYVETSIVGVGAGSSINLGFSNDKTATGNRFDGSTVSPTHGWTITNVLGNFNCADSANSGVAIIPTFTAGDTIDWAFDTGGLLAWARKNGGTWNATSGGGDPALGTGGMAATLTGGGPYFFFYGADGNNGDQVTAVFAASSWVRSAPAGYTQISA